MTHELIPKYIWLCIKAFLDAKGTGSIVLYVKDGVILRGKVEQEIRAN